MSWSRSYGRRSRAASSDLAPTRALARTVDAVVGGALLTWAFHVEVAARSWLRTHVDAVLAPHLAAARECMRAALCE